MQYEYYGAIRPPTTTPDDAPFPSRPVFRHVSFPRVSQQASPTCPFFPVAGPLSEIAIPVTGRLLTRAVDEGSAVLCVDWWNWQAGMRDLGQPVRRLPLVTCCRPACSHRLRVGVALGAAWNL